MLYTPPTKAAVGLSNVDNTADTAKPVSTAQQTALDLKAPLASPAFTGTPTGITKTHVGLGNVDNTSDASKPVSTAQQTALNLKAPLASPTFTGTPVFPAGSIAASALAAIPESGVTNLTTDLAAKAPLASPAFTGTPTGITKAHVGLGNVDNTADTAKPVSTAQQTALDLKAPLASPTFTGTPTFPAGSIAATALAAIPESGVTNLTTDLAAKAPLASPAFTGTPTGITKAHVGLGNVDNTADTAKPVSTAQQTALDLKAPLASPTFTGTPTFPAGSIAAAALAAIPESGVTNLTTDLAAKAPLASPAFTGTPTGITKAHVGLGNVDNTSDASKPVSTAQAAADALRVLKAGDSLTGALSVSRGLTTDSAYSAAVTGDTQNRINVQAGGVIGWGSGSATADTNLYRSAVGVLNTDNSMVVGNWGAQSLTIQRSASGFAATVYSTDVAGNGISLILLTPTQTALQVIKSGDSFTRYVVDGNGKATWGGGTVAGDTNLYRNAAGVLKTDGTISAAAYQVNGVALAKADVGLSNVDNTSDVSKRMNFTQVEIDAGATPVNELEVTVTDAALTSTCEVIAWMSWDTPTGKDADDVPMDTYIVNAGNNGNGTMQIRVRALDGPLYDKYKVNYSMTTG